MSGFGVVLVGVDGSEVANAALVFAAEEAARRGSRLHIVHVASTHAADAPLEVRPFDEIVCTEAVATVAAVQPRVDCEVLRGRGDPATVLVDLSAEADLLVVGTHRMGRVRGFVLGSVSQRAAAHSMCPVVTISGPSTHADGPIVLGASASPGGLAALAFACEEARVRGVGIHAIRAISFDDWLLAGPAAATVITAGVLKDAARLELDTVLREAGERYADVHIDGEVSDEHAFTALLAAAEHASMIVIGARRSQTSPLPHLGPVAAWLLHQAQCPMAVVGHPTVARASDAMATVAVGTTTAD